MLSQALRSRSSFFTPFLPSHSVSWGYTWQGGVCASVCCFHYCLGVIFKRRKGVYYSGSQEEAHSILGLGSFEECSINGLFAKVWAGWRGSRGHSRLPEAGAQLLLNPCPSLRGKKREEVTGIQKRELSGKSHPERVAVAFGWGDPVRRPPKDLIIFPPSHLLGVEGRSPMGGPQPGLRGQGRPWMAPSTLTKPLGAESSVETGGG